MDWSVWPPPHNSCCWLTGSATCWPYRVLGLNALWILHSGLLLLSGWVAPNLLGYAFVIGQAVVVLVLIELEWVGLKRSQAMSGAFTQASVGA